MQIFIFVITLQIYKVLCAKTYCVRFILENGHLNGVGKDLHAPRLYHTSISPLRVRTSMIVCPRKSSDSFLKCCFTRDAMSSSSSHTLTFILSVALWHSLQHKVRVVRFSSETPFKGQWFRHHTQYRQKYWDICNNHKTWTRKPHPLLTYRYIKYTATQSPALNNGSRMGGHTDEVSQPKNHIIGHLSIFMPC